MTRARPPAADAQPAATAATAAAPGTAASGSGASGPTASPPLASTASSLVAALSARPVALRPAWVASTVLVGALLALAVLLLAADLRWVVPMIIDDLSIGERGRPARAARLWAPRCGPATPLERCDLELRWLADDGRVRTRSYALMSFSGPRAPAVPLDARVDPARSERVSTAPGRATLAGRLAWQGVLLLPLALGTVVLSLSLARQLARLRQHARLRRRARPVEARLLDARLRSGASRIALAWRDPVDGRERVGDAALPFGERPLFLDAARTRVLAFVHGGLVAVPDAELALLPLDPAERARLVGLARADQGLALDAGATA